MQAVILAGGLGTRLWPLTKEVPKPMVPIAGKPYLAYQLELLAQQEIRDIVLLTGYLAEQIEDYFGDGSNFGLKIAYSREQTPLGTGGALRQARPLLNKQFLLIYGDSFLPIQYGDVLQTLASNPSWLAVLAAYDNLEDTSVRNNLALTPEGAVLAYEKDSLKPELTHVEAGVIGLDQSALDLLPPTDPCSLENFVFPLLISRGALAAFSTPVRFFDIGTPDRLSRIETYFRHDHH